MKKKTLISLLLLMTLISACGKNNIPSDSVTPSNNEPITSESFSSENISTSVITPLQSSSANTSQQGNTSSEVSFSSETSESNPSTPKELLTPTLTFVSETLIDEVRHAYVSWNPQEEVTVYDLMIGLETYQTIETQYLLPYGETLSVRARKDELYSDWSLPFSFFGNPKEEDVHYQVSAPGYISIYYKDADLAPIQIERGTTALKPKNPTKEDHLFAGWYEDPFYTVPFDFNKPLNESTTIYAHWLKASFIDNVNFWIKVNEFISASVISTERPNSLWRFVPLSRQVVSGEHSLVIYTAEILVTGASSNNPAKLLAMDGFDDLPGRSYWKNGDKDFEIYSDGMYRVSFSTQTQWKEGNGTLVNLYIEPIDLVPFEPSPSLPETPSSLTPELYLDEANSIVYFDAIPNASYYEYVLNNGNIRKTISTTIAVDVFDYITVRAVFEDGTRSTWSRALLRSKVTFAEEEVDETVQIYFYGLNENSFLVTKNSLIIEPYVIEKEGYTWDGWYTSIKHETRFNFDEPITKDTIIYGLWTPITSLEQMDFFDIVDSLGNVVGTFKLNTSNMSYVEYKSTFSAPSGEFTFYINRRSDETVIYGPYKVATKTTYSLYFSEDYVWDVGTSNASNLYIARFDIYFSNAAKWSNVHYYAWNKTSGTYHTSWPGSKMTYVKTNEYGEDIYKVTLNLAKYDYIIFSNGSGSQTVDISLTNLTNNTGYYTTTQTGGKYNVGKYQYA